MLRFISWANFILAATLCCFCYWIVVLLIYYRRELRSVVKRRPLPVPVAFEQEIPLSDDSFDQCSRCAAVIKTLIREKSLYQTSKESLLAAIQVALISYQNFHHSSLEVPINNLIKFETAQHFSIMLDDQDIKSVWN
jgi:uncharacterized membrane protein